MYGKCKKYNYASSFKFSLHMHIYCRMFIIVRWLKMSQKAETKCHKNDTV